MLEHNQIYLGDCLDIMKNIENKSVDMILCDLPYGTTQCSWDTIIPFETLWSQYNRVIKDNGAIVLFGAEPFSSLLRTSNLKLYKYDWKWEKSKATGFLNSKKRPLVAHEDVIVFYKKQPTYNPQFTIATPYNKGIRKQQTQDDVYGSFEQVEVKSEGKRFPRSVQYFKTAESEGRTHHKTQKPLLLCQYLIKTYTNDGELVLDNCIGSGTTAVACINTNRNFIGIEKDEQIFNTAVNRINKNKAS
jgi:DNA modification methylase